MGDLLQNVYLMETSNVTFLSFDLVDARFVVDHFLPLNDTDDVGESFDAAVVDVKRDERVQVWKDEIRLATEIMLVKLDIKGNSWIILVRLILVSEMVVIQMTTLLITQLQLGFESVTFFRGQSNKILWIPFSLLNFHSLPHFFLSFALTFFVQFHDPSDYHRANIF